LIKAKSMSHSASCLWWRASVQPGRSTFWSIASWWDAGTRTAHMQQSYNRWWAYKCATESSSLASM